jgi:ATP-dependent DNA helicase RecQ
VTGDEVGRVRRLAREVFGHGELRPGQEEAVSAVLEGRDVLLVSPTGAGTSFAYQAAGVLLEGSTLLVSPLVALQKDQLDHHPDDRRTRGARISSAETPSRRRAALDALEAGELEYLALAPEQLVRDEVWRRLVAHPPSLVAVDEAHCISAWGHEFRPDYLRRGDLVDQLAGDGDRPRVVATTATAAAPVRADIAERLHLQRPAVIVTGFRRDNIDLSVERCLDADDQRARVVEGIQRAERADLPAGRARRAPHVRGGHRPGRRPGHRHGALRGRGLPRPQAAGRRGPRPREEVD